MPAKQINLNGWQDYRGQHSALVVYVETSKQSVLPIRDQLDEQGKGNLYEPNYETRTYGFTSAFNTKQINNALKSKYRYLLFLTRYEGLSREYKDQYLIHGYMRIDKTIDARKRHMNAYLSKPEGTPEPEALHLDKAMALYSEDMHFYNPEDCFVLNPETLGRWGSTSRLSRQMKLILDAAALDEVLAHFATKTPADDDYLSTIQDYLSELGEGEEDED